MTVAGETSYNYEVTNHGLIRADNLVLDLPKSHPFLVFSWDAPLGDVDANTTVVVPVRVYRKPGTRRRRSSGCHAGVATYSVECAGTKYSGIGLTFSGGEPCGSGGGSGGGSVSPGGGGGSSGGGGGGCGWCSGGGSYYSSPSEFKSLDFCDPCTKNVFDCLVGFTVSWGGGLYSSVVLFGKSGLPDMLLRMSKSNRNRGNTDAGPKTGHVIHSKNMSLTGLRC